MRAVAWTSTGMGPASDTGGKDGWVATRRQLKVITLSKSASVDMHLWTFCSNNDRMTRVQGVVINTAVFCRKDKSADHLNLNTALYHRERNAASVKKGPDRVPGGNGNGRAGSRALAGILDRPRP